MSDFPIPVVERVRHELKLREVEVARVAALTPGMRRVTFSGEALADFSSLSFDDHVKFMFTGAGGEQVRRDYTPRRFDREARELDIDFVLHGHGQAAAWARGATVGQRALIGGPRGSMIIPRELDWHLLAGDASALPAIARRLEELPATARAFVLVLHEGERLELAGPAQAELHWLASGEEMIAALRELALPEGSGFAWGAGEAALMARVRQALLEKGLPRQAARVSAYWKHGVSQHHEHLD